MGRFNDVFRLLCDEVFFVSGKELALAWNEKLKNEQSSIDESTINRWKDDTLPRRFYLPKIVKLFSALNAEWRASGEEGAFSPELRSRLLLLCGQGREAAGARRGELAKKKGDGAFLTGVFEAAYLSQKTARDGNEPSPARPGRNRRRLGIALAALLATGSVGTVGALIVNALVSAGSSGASRLIGDGIVLSGDRETQASLTRSVAEDDLTAARRFVAAGAVVNAPYYRGDRGRLDFLRRACEGTISSFPPAGRLEELADAWGIYWETALPCFSKTGPAREARNPALRLALCRGEPDSFAHFYLNLEPRPRAVRLTFSASLYLELNRGPGTAGTAGPGWHVSVSRFDGKRRYELAWQWENGVEEGPHWRRWDPDRGWIDTGITGKLELGAWHRLSFAGRIERGGVRYEYLEIDGENFAVDASAATVPLKDPYVYLAVAVQLNSGPRAEPFAVRLRDISLETGE